MIFKYRPVTEEDFSRMLELFQEFAHFEKQPHKMINELDKMKRQKDHFKAIVAENEEGLIIGFASYSFVYHTWVGLSLYMDDLYVQEPYRGQGLGKELLTQIIQLAQSRDCNRVRWLVSDWNTNAQAFYKKMGATIRNQEWICDLILE